MAQARGYERGTAGVRDYRAAANIYREVCDDGKGDLDACGELIRAATRSRGADFDKPELQGLAAKTCVSRHDPFTCVMADMLSGSSKSVALEVRTAIAETLNNLPPCDKNHLSSCWAAYVGESLLGSDGSTAQERKRNNRRNLCELDILEACIEIVESATFSGELTEAELGSAGRRLMVACDRGDADACEVAPGRTPIATKLLCAASDYNACAILGCTGNDAAAKIAASHNVQLHNCDELRSVAQSPSLDHYLSQLKDIRDAVCTCKTSDCIDVAFNRLSQLNAALTKDQARGDSQSQAEFERIQIEMQSCAAKVGWP